jgi:hypothetical protein
MPQPGTGRADFLLLGDFNAYCSMCGRKRKASQLQRNWQGLYRCPEHNEPRQPQDFARGIREDISTPWAQLLADDVFLPFNPTFPLSISPASIVLAAGDIPLETESDETLLTESGNTLEVETGYLGQLAAIPPGWITPASYQWSWLSGGAGIAIEFPNAQTALLYATATGLSGVIQCLVTSSLGSTATATASVSG